MRSRWDRDPYLKNLFRFNTSDISTRPIWKYFSDSGNLKSYQNFRLTIRRHFWDGVGRYFSRRGVLSNSSLFILSTGTHTGLQRYWLFKFGYSDFCRGSLSKCSKYSDQRRPGIWFYRGIWKNYRYWGGHTSITNTHSFYGIPKNREFIKFSRNETGPSCY